MRVARLQPWSRPRDAVWLLLRGATFRTCAPVAVIVGTVLSVVNQGDVIASGMGDAVVAAKVAANMTIPYLTSSAGALLAVRRRVEAPRLEDLRR
jgi:hypothetical protein